MDKATLATLILVNQRQRNVAIGIANDPQFHPQFLRGMASFIHSTSEAQFKATAKRLAEVVFLKAMIEEHQALATRLTDYIMDNLEDDDIRNEGVYAMTKLEAYVNHMAEKLEDVLWQT